MYIYIDYNDIYSTYTYIYIMHRNNGCFFIIVHALSKNEPPPRLNGRAAKNGDATRPRTKSP